MTPHPALTVVGRALPRLAAVVAGAVLVGLGSGVLDAVGTVVLVLALATDPVRWWRRVRTGRDVPGALPPELTEPGTWRVVLEDAGPRPIEVVKAIRDVTPVGFPEARAQVQQQSVTVVTGLSEASAGRVRDRLVRAGATAGVVGG